MQDKKRRYHTNKGGTHRLLSFLALFALVFFSACTKTQKESAHKVFTIDGQTMGTTYHISILDEPEIPRHAIDSILDLINTTFSTYDSISFISRMNQGRLEQWKSSHDKVLYKSCEEHMFNVLGMSQGIYLRTNGAFDPSGAPLFNMWGFAESESRNPTTEEIDSVLKFVGLNKYSFEKKELNKPVEGFTLNFNAIAKGYAVDVVAMYLMRKGYRDLMVEIGGEVLALGSNAEGQKWVIGINKPDSESSSTSLIDTVHVSGGGLATSGNYRNFYRDNDGNIIGHTIDPRTGRPASSDLLSVSIKHPSCAVADAYATAAMTAGSAALEAWIENDQLLTAVIVFDSAGNSVVKRLGY